MTSCPHCHKLIEQNVIQCPYCKQTLKAFGHPGIPLHQAPKDQFSVGNAPIITMTLAPIPSDPTRKPVPSTMIAKSLWSVQWVLIPLKRRGGDLKAGVGAIKDF